MEFGIKPLINYKKWSNVPLSGANFRSDRLIIPSFYVKTVLSQALFITSIYMNEMGVSVCR